MPATPGNRAIDKRTQALIKESVKCWAQTADSKAQLQEIIAATQQAIQESRRVLVYATEQMQQK